MYLHLGQNTVVPKRTVVGIFDLDNASQSHITRKFLSNMEKEGKLINISDDLPKSFVICCEGGDTVIYLSQLSSSTLLKRADSAVLF